MAGINEAQVFGGHTAKILKDGVELGFMLDVSYNVDHGLQDVNVLGQVTTVEHQQTRYVVTGEARQYYVRDEIVNPDNSLVPKTAAEAIRQGGFDLDIVDTVTGRLIIRLEKVSLASNGAAIQAGALISKRLSFRALNTRI